MNCGNEIKWRLILAVMNAIICNCVKKPEKKIQDFNGVWTRDLAIPVRRSNQLSYEATDVGSRSIVGSYVPVKVKNESDAYETRRLKAIPWDALLYECYFVYDRWISTFCVASRFGGICESYCLTPVECFVQLIRTKFTSSIPHMYELKEQRFASWRQLLPL